MANKSTIVNDVMEQHGLKEKEASKIVDSVLSSIRTSLLKGDEMRIMGLGTFSVRDRAARAGRNPKTGEPLEIKASKAPHFKPSKTLKEDLNK